MSWETKHIYTDVAKKPRRCSDCRGMIKAGERHVVVSACNGRAENNLCRACFDNAVTLVSASLQGVSP